MSVIKMKPDHPVAGRNGCGEERPANDLRENDLRIPFCPGLPGVQIEGSGLRAAREHERRGFAIELHHQLIFLLGEDLCDCPSAQMRVNARSEPV